MLIKAELNENMYRHGVLKVDRHLVSELMLLIQHGSFTREQSSTNGRVDL